MRLREVIRLAAVLAALAAAGWGCATTGEDESDLPWNMSQPWESSPGLPSGMIR